MLAIHFIHYETYAFLTRCFIYCRTTIFHLSEQDNSIYVTELKYSLQKWLASSRFKHLNLPSKCLINFYINYLLHLHSDLSLGCVITFHFLLMIKFDFWNEYRIIVTDFSIYFKAENYWLLCNFFIEPSKFTWDIN